MLCSQALTTNDPLFRHKGVGCIKQTKHYSKLPDFDRGHYCVYKIII